MRKGSAMTKKYNDSINGKKLRPESLMMTYGYKPEWSEGALKLPIFQTSTFVFKTAEEGKSFFELAYGLRKKDPKETPGLIYSRLNNPNNEVLENRLALWDGAADCLVFESGMAAIATTLFEFLRPGDALLYSEPLYGGTDHLIHHVLTQFGVKPIGFPPMATEAEIEELLKKNDSIGKLGMIYLETPANPTNDLVDIELCARIAKKHSTAKRKVPVAVDNTFLGPIWSQPLKFGADIVLYSATKFIGGHSDVIAGMVLGTQEMMDRIRGLRTFFGTLASPWTSWLLLRSIETLKLRMTCQMKNAQVVADFLKDHPKVEKVYYLGHISENSPQYPIYKKQCSAPGSMISFDVRGGEKEAFKFLNSLKLIKLAVSLGGTESLAQHPQTMTHADVSPEVKKRLSISEKMIRLSIGVEHPDDIIADITQALEQS